MTKKLIGEFVVTGLAGYLTGIAISHIKNNKKAKCDLIFDESSPEQTMYLKINDNIRVIYTYDIILARETAMSLWANCGVLLICGEARLFFYTKYGGTYGEAIQDIPSTNTNPS